VKIFLKNKLNFLSEQEVFSNVIMALLLNND